MKNDNHKTYTCQTILFVILNVHPGVLFRQVYTAQQLNQGMQAAVVSLPLLLVSTRDNHVHNEVACWFKVHLLQAVGVLWLNVNMVNSKVV